MGVGGCEVGDEAEAGEEVEAGGGAGGSAGEGFRGREDEELEVVK